jgi:hypothetical protein
MNNTRFLTITFLFSFLFLLAKIYQHNKLVKTRYEQQAIHMAYKKIKKVENDLLVKLQKIKKQTSIKETAKESLKMKPLALSQIRSRNTTNDTLS